LPSPSCVRYAAVAALTVGGFHVGSDFASKAVWLVGGGSDCRHGAGAGRVRAGGSTDRRHGASAITTPRAAHGSANAAHGSSCRAGLPARRSSRRDVNHLLSAGPPQWGGLVMVLFRRRALGRLSGGRLCIASRWRSGRSEAAASHFSQYASEARRAPRRW
jgi:hypothetical protein